MNEHDNDNNSNEDNNSAMEVCDNEEDDSSYSYSYCEDVDDDNDNDSQVGDCWEDDLDAVDKDNGHPNEAEQGKLPAVELELPSELLGDDKSPEDPPLPEPNVKCSPVAAAAPASSPSVETESWSHLTQDLAQPQQASFASRDTSVGVSSYTYNVSNDDVASSNTSIISGFDCLDIDGYTLKRCHLDGYLNDPDAVFCGGCGAALVANPHVDADHQIALHLQQQEEQNAVAARQGLAQQPLFQQAEVWSSAVAERVETYSRLGNSSRKTRCFPLPQGDRILSTARFIQCAKKRLEHNPLTLSYRVTSRDAATVRKVHSGQDATDVKVFDNLTDAVHHWAKCKGSLPTISEEPTDGGDPKGCRVWIVAVAAGRRFDKFPNPNTDPQGHSHHNDHRPTAPTTSSTANDVDAKKRPQHQPEVLYFYQTVHGADATLPLASLEFSDTVVLSVVTGLYNALEQVCGDFWIDADLVHRPAPAQEPEFTNEERWEQERMFRMLEERRSAWDQAHKSNESGAERTNEQDETPPAPSPPPPVPVHDNTLPAGWSQYFDATLRKYYYRHHLRGITTWHREQVTKFSMTETPAAMAAEGISEPRDHDVLLGRRDDDKQHSGNQHYQSMVRAKTEEYFNSNRFQKPMVALELVHAWRALDPTGRFLERDEAGLWYDVGDRKAREQTSRALAGGVRFGQDTEGEEVEGEGGGDTAKLPRTAQGGGDSAKPPRTAQDVNLFAQVGPAVVQIGRWDEATRRIECVGSGFVCHKKYGLVATAARNLVSETNALRLGTSDGKNSIVIGVNQVWRYKAVLLVDDLDNNVDACILKITARMATQPPGSETLLDTEAKMAQEPLVKLRCVNELDEQNTSVRVFGHRQPRNDLRGLSTAHGTLLEEALAVLDKEETAKGRFEGGSPLVDGEGAVVGMLRRTHPNPTESSHLSLVSAYQLKSLVYRARALVVRGASLAISSSPQAE